MKNFKRLSILSFIFCFLFLAISGSNASAASSLPAKPSSNIYVQDYANILSSGTESKILQEAETIQQKTTAQVCVVTINSLEGQDVESYANELFRKWGIGDKTKNNGVLLLISKGDRKTRLEIGPGLEGAITDIESDSILEEMSKSFKANDYDKGVDSAFSLIGTKVYKEYNIDETLKSDSLSTDSASTDSIELPQIDTKTAIIVALAFLIALVLAIKIFGVEFVFDVIYMLICMFSSGGGGGGKGGSSFGGGSSDGGGASGDW